MDKGKGTSFPIPSREEHRRLIRKLWTYCILGATLVFVTTGGVVLGMFLAGYESQKVVEVSTSVFQVVILSYGLGFFVPMLTTSLLKMSLGVEMSRQGLEIGQQTASTLAEFKEDVKPLVMDAKRIVSDITPVVHDAKVVFEDFKKQDLGKVRDALNRIEVELAGGGKLERLLVALEKIAKRADSKADDALGDLLEEAWSGGSRCGKCGEYLWNGTVECPKCGTKVDSPAGT